MSPVGIFLFVAGLFLLTASMVAMVLIVGLWIFILVREGGRDRSLNDLKPVREFTVQYSIPVNVNVMVLRESTESPAEMIVEAEEEDLGNVIPFRQKTDN